MLRSIGALEILLLLPGLLLLGCPASSQPHHSSRTVLPNLRHTTALTIQNEQEDLESHHIHPQSDRVLKKKPAASVPVCFETQTSSNNPSSTFETRYIQGVVGWLRNRFRSGRSKIRVHTPGKTCEELCPCDANSICSAIHPKRDPAYTCTCRDGFVLDKNSVCVPICGGFAGLSCPDGLLCVGDPNDDCDPNNGGADCSGICVEDPPFCGGFAGLRCPDDLVCIDDPKDDCDPNKGGADCGGICVQEKEVCAGLAGLDCPLGLVCIDDPNDDCNPEKGGADCSGICIQQSCNSQVGRLCPDDFQCESVTPGCRACDGICVRIPN